MKLIVQGKKGSIDVVTDGDTVKDLKNAYVKQTKMKGKYAYYELSFKTEDEKTRIDNDSKKLSEYDLKDGSVIKFKNLGPQIGYKFVFVAEYAGPIVFVLLWYLFRRISPKTFWYAKDKEMDPVAYIGVVCWVAHFLKREYETFFIHKFSRVTMPLSNLFKNCTYYWLFAIFVGHPLCSPDFESPSEVRVYTGLAIFILSEIGNLYTHILLSNLRPAAGSKQRPIPTGFGFDLVACPNYTFEVLSWVGFSIFTNVAFSYLFTIVGFGQMTQWALQKHKGYKNDHGDEYKKLGRKAIVPFII